VSLSRDPLALTRISRATGLNIVMGAGYYVAAAHPADMDTRSEDSIVREVTVGVGDTGVRAGLIGEIGNTWPWTENEKKVVRAAVEAQRQTGAPLMIHPGRDQAAPTQIVELIGKQGGNLKATVMCHIERTISDERHLVDLAATGAWLEYDLFGLENSYYPYNRSSCRTTSPTRAHSRSTAGTATITCSFPTHPRTRADVGSYGGSRWAAAGTRSIAISSSQRPARTNPASTPSACVTYPMPTERPSV